MAAADVKPAVTGIEMNCTKKPAITVQLAINIGPARCIMNEANVPRFSSPKSRIMIPLRNADKMAKSGLVLTYRCTMSAIIAVGPV